MADSEEIDVTGTDTDNPDGEDEEDRDDHFGEDPGYRVPNKRMKTEENSMHQDVISGINANSPYSHRHIHVPVSNMMHTSPSGYIIVESNPTQVVLCSQDMPIRLPDSSLRIGDSSFALPERVSPLLQPPSDTATIPITDTSISSAIPPVPSNKSDFTHAGITGLPPPSEHSQGPVTEKDEERECGWFGCGAAFSCLTDLVNHVNDNHVKVERDVEYKCHWVDCPRKGRGFNARYKMLIHVRTHTSEKPHQCNLCDKRFSRLENLKIHHRSHTGERPYACPFPGCKKAYSNSSDRFKHVRTHQIDKPYACKMPGCSKRYTDPSSLRKHVKTHGHNPQGTTQTETEDRARKDDIFNSKDDLMSRTVTTYVSSSSIVNATHPTVGIPGTILTVPSTPNIPLSLPTHMISIHGVQLSALASNPLLSSAVVCGQGQTSPLVVPDSPSKDLHSVSDIPLLGEVSTKLPDQEMPLDLSTGLMHSSSSQPVSEVIIGDDQGDYNGKWELVSPE